MDFDIISETQHDIDFDFWLSNSHAIMLIINVRYGTWSPEVFAREDPGLATLGHWFSTGFVYFIWIASVVIMDPEGWPFSSRVEASHRTVYVDDFKMAGPQESMSNGWQVVSTKIDMDTPGKVNRYMGCVVGTVYPLPSEITTPFTPVILHALEGGKQIDGDLNLVFSSLRFDGYAQETSMDMACNSSSYPASWNTFWILLMIFFVRGDHPNNGKVTGVWFRSPRSRLV